MAPSGGPAVSVAKSLCGRWTGIAIALGILLRIIPYLRNRSLWYDEALLALNILHRPIEGLFQPLCYHQAAPVGFLLVEKLSSIVFGRSELSLRLAPLFLRIAALFLFWRVAALSISPKAIPLAVMLFALNQPLIYYSSELKQYSGDVAITLLLLWAVLRWDHSDKCWVDTVSLALLGTLAVWFSHPASFVLAGCGAVLIFSAWLSRRRAQFTPVACVIGVWSASFLAFYVLSLRRLAQDQILQNFWRADFPPSLVSLNGASWLIAHMLVVFGDPPALATIISAALFVAGCGSLIMRNGKLFWIVGASSAITLIAACIHRYPLAGRLMLFGMAISLLFVAEGAVWLADTFMRSPATRVALIVVILTNSLWMAGRAFIARGSPDDIKPMVRYIIAHQQLGDRIYSYYFAQYQYRYYADLYNLPIKNLTVGDDCGQDMGCYKADLDRLRGVQRLWVLISHNMVRNKQDDAHFLLFQLDTIGARLDERRSSGARVYLYDLSTLKAVRSRSSR